ncbi:MAG: DUF1254 domain-containing protein [Hyphomicrobiales bacterium]|nr:DUF1254 domain-containing protein [Hyphomicrobiales bacterium]
MNPVTRRNALLGATSLAAVPALGSAPQTGLALSEAKAQTAPVGFPGGFPSAELAQRLYDEADLNRAIEAYKFFYPNISMAGLAAPIEEIAPIENKAFFIVVASPKQVLFTPNSDTPYALLPLDLRAGPITVELPPGPLIGVANDWNFRWVMDMGVPGPDAGKGGKHIILPPDWKGDIPQGYYTGQSTTYRVFLIIRSIPQGPDMEGAIARIRTVKVRPLEPPPSWSEPTWTDVSDRSFDATPITWEKTLRFWEVLYQIIDTEPAYAPYRDYYGVLAGLGIVKGKPFTPGERMKGILERAAQAANDQMRVASLADRRPDRIVWPDRKSWEWITLVPENGTFDAPTYVDIDARAIWFWQATFESPAMFRRQAGGGSVYWFAARDKTGAFVDGGKLYKLTMPQPVPVSLFWSVTVYDPDTRSEIQTDQGKAALRSLFELKDVPKTGAAELYFGPSAPGGKEGQWIKTNPGKGWFVYLRLYGPEAPAFDGSWKPGDIEPVK